MQPWFTWKGKNSFSDFGLWINKLPPIVRAPERYEEITVPGKAGTLLMTEGEDIYDSYLKECVVIIPNTHNIQPIIAWLRGSGEVTFSNEPEFVYEARIAGEVSFERIDNNLLQATIPFFVKPYKKRKTEEEIVTTESVWLYNPGDVASKPYLVLNAPAGSTVSIAISDRIMTFYDVPHILNIDCDTGIVTYYAVYPGTPTLWTGSYTGEFLRIPTWTCAAVINSSQTPFSLTINPRWRWV